MNHNPKVSILFVCLGNICRSAAAEAIANKFIRENGLQRSIAVDSAGILNYHEGESADPRMIAHAAKRGYEVTSISRPVVWDDYERFDLLVAMDDSNVHALYERAPDIQGTRKVVRMADYLRQHPGNDHIPDPYYGGAKGFELVIDLLEDGIGTLLREISMK